MVTALNDPKNKTGKRIVPLLPSVVEMLYHLKNEQIANNLKCRYSVGGVDDFVFFKPNGTPYDHRFIFRVIKRVTEKCNKDAEAKGIPIVVPHFSSHILRHTFITRAVEQNTNIKALQSIVGHADFSMTLNVYTTSTESFKAEAIKNMENVLSPLEQPLVCYPFTTYTPDEGKNKIVLNNSDISEKNTVQINNA